jgi:GT2 family glycosyltransferase
VVALSSQPAGEARVTVGLVTWNSERHLPSCLQSLANQTHQNLELIVVDNGSQDHSVDLVRAQAPEARVFTNSRNQGHCRAHNLTIGASAGDYYLGLMPDVRLDPEYIKRLVLSLQGRPAFGSALGKMWQARPMGAKVLDGTGLFIDRRRHPYLRGHGEIDQGQYDKSEEVFGADGAAPLYRRKTLEDVTIFGQVFDESFFMYQEDVDLAWRARVFGWQCWYEPRATAVRDRGVRPDLEREEARELRRIALRNRYVTILKNESWRTFRRDWWRILFYHLRILARVLVRDPSSSGAYRSLLANRRLLMRWRRAVQGAARVRPSYRLKWFA